MRTETIGVWISVGVNFVVLSTVVVGALSSWFLPKQGLDEYDVSLSVVAGALATIGFCAVMSTVAVVSASRQCRRATNLIAEKLADHEESLKHALGQANKDTAEILFEVRATANLLNILRSSQDGFADSPEAHFLVSVDAAARIEHAQSAGSKILIVNPDLQIEKLEVRDPADRRRKTTFGEIVQRNLSKGVRYLLLHHRLETAQISSIRTVFGISDERREGVRFLAVPLNDSVGSDQCEKVSELVRGLMTTTITIYNFGVVTDSTVLITPRKFFTGFSLGLPDSLAIAVHEALKRYVASHADGQDAEGK